MTDADGGEAPADADVKAAAEAALSSQGDEDTSGDVEAAAAEMGWKPKSEWKGDTAGWIDAQAFVEQQERIDKIVEKRLGKVRKDYEDRFGRLERTSKAGVEALQRAHAAEIADLKAKRREAEKADDDEAVEKIDAKIDKLKDEAPRAEVTATSRASIEDQAKAFVEANPWYMEEPDMALFLDHWTEKNGNLNKKLTFEENMAAGVAATMRKFPDKFRDSKKTGGNGHSPVDGGSVFAGGKPKTGKSASDLPAEARAIGNELVKAKAFKDLDAYAKEYFKNA